MNRDTLTVIWKEWRSILRSQSRRWRVIAMLGAPLILFGVYVPWDAGEYWLAGPLPIIGAIALAILTVVLTIPDSIAGERERHTLETLLASRLPDRAIVYGKLGFSFGLASMIALSMLVLGLITFNLAHWNGSVTTYELWTGLAALAFSILIALLGAGIGVSVSLRAASAQEAQQTLTMLMFLPPTFLGITLMLLGRRASEGGGIVELVSRWDPVHIGIVLAGILLIVDIVVIVSAVRRFERASLIKVV
jgi:ABC-2 type transport system permease protein